MASQKGLGKGLGALLGDFAEEPSARCGAMLLEISAPGWGMWWKSGKTAVKTR